MNTLLPNFVGSFEAPTTANTEFDAKNLSGSPRDDDTPLADILLLCVINRGKEFPVGTGGIRDNRVKIDRALRDRVRALDDLDIYYSSILLANYYYYYYYYYY